MEVDRIKSTLQFLAVRTKQQNSRLIEHLPSDVIRDLAEVMLNISNGNIRLTDQEASYIGRNRHKLKRIYSSKSGLLEKRDTLRTLDLQLIIQAALRHLNGNPNEASP